MLSQCHLRAAQGGGQKHCTIISERNPSHGREIKFSQIKFKVEQVNSGKDLSRTPSLLQSKPVCILINDGDDCQVSTSKTDSILQREGGKRQSRPLLRMWEIKKTERGIKQ